MNRREVIKGIAATAAIAIVPPVIPAISSTPLPIHFIGLGGAGCNGLEVIYAKKNSGHFTCITDIARTHLPPAIQFIPFQSIFTPSTSAAACLPDYNFAFQLTAAIQMLLSQPQQYVLLAGLGGYTGTRLLQAFTGYLLKKNRPFTIVASLPFTWETDRRKSVETRLPHFQALPQFHAFDLSQLSKKGEKGNINMKLFMQLANEEFYTIYRQCNII